MRQAQVAESPRMILGALRVIGKRSEFLPGMVGGLCHPSAFCTIEMAGVPPDDLAPLDECMQSYFSEPLPALPSAPADRRLALLYRIHEWHAALQRDLGILVFGPCRVSPPRRSSNPDAPVFVYTLIIPYAVPQASRECLLWVVSVVNKWLASHCLSSDDRASLQQSLSEVRNTLKGMGIQATNPIHFHAAADRLGIPVARMGQSHFVFGLGEHSRWMNSSITDRTSSIGVTLARHKHETASILRRFGMPAPTHAMVSSEEQAVRAALKLGFPVVVKPNDQDQGRGVFAGLASEEDVRKSYREANKFSKWILVEEHVLGEDYRFTVFQDRVIKIMHRRAGGVHGDGHSTIAALLRQVQASPEHQRALRRQGTLRLQMDQEALDLLSEQQLDPEAIPAKDQFVPLRRKSNISTGGSHRLLPVEQTHPDNCALAVRAARVLGLDLAGIDLIIQDPAKPWHETGGAICEVNAQPQIGIRETPEIYADILRGMIPRDGTIEVHLLLTPGSMAASSFPIEHYRHLASSLHCNALTTPSGAWIDGVQCAWRPQNSFASANALLYDKKVKSLFIVMTVSDVLRFGCPVARLASLRVQSTAAGETSVTDQMALREALQRLKPQVRPAEANIHPSLRPAAEEERIL